MNGFGIPSLNEELAINTINILFAHSIEFGINAIKQIISSMRRRNASVVMDMNQNGPIANLLSSVLHYLFDGWMSQVLMEDIDLVSKKTTNCTFSPEEVK